MNRVNYKLVNAQVAHSGIMQVLRRLANKGQACVFSCDLVWKPDQTNGFPRCAEPDLLLAHVIDTRYARAGAALLGLEALSNRYLWSLETLC